MSQDDTPGNPAAESEACMSDGIAASIISQYSAFGDILKANTARGDVKNIPAGAPRQPDVPLSQDPTAPFTSLPLATQPQQKPRPSPPGVQAGNYPPATASPQASHPTLPRQHTSQPAGERSDRYGPASPATERSIFSVIAVIPAYNEELAIGSVVLRTRPHVDHVIVVDDGSTDRTAEIASMAGAEVLQHTLNMGKAAAIMRGFERARAYGPRAVVMLDGDGQHNPSEIPSLVRPVLAGEADFVVGSRHLNGNNRIPAYRKLGQKTLDLATNVQAGSHSSDTQSGFRALGRAALANLDFHSEGFNIESDMLSHFTGRNLRILEVPIEVKYEIPNGHSKNPLSHGMDILGHVIGVVGYKRPLLSFGVPGVALAIIGSIAIIYTISEYFAGSSFHTIAFIGGMTSLILGLLLMTTSLILNSLVQIVKFNTIDA
jgi:glycosyltransferase involved in cell wall biosynthesis